MEGTAFPDYELPDQNRYPAPPLGAAGRRPDGTGPVPRLLLPQGPHLKTLIPFSAHCTVGYTRLVTITTDTLMQLNELRMGLGADWTFSYDEERTIQKELEIQEYTDPEHDPMLPYTFVLV